MKTLSYILLLCFAFVLQSTAQDQKHLNFPEGMQTVSGKIQVNGMAGNQQLMPFPQALLQIEASDGKTYYGTTDEEGRYKIPIPMGTAVLDLVAGGVDGFSYVSSSDTSEGNEPIGIDPEEGGGGDIIIQVTTHCPLLEVDLSTPYIVHCSNTYYSVNYNNSGTDTAYAAYVELELDGGLTYDSSQLASTSLGANTYRFELGDIAPNAVGHFKVYVHSDCDGTSGQTFCSEARIYPDIVCDSIWDGPVLELDANCQGDSIEFMIQNNGTDMLAPRNIVIIENDVMLFSGSIDLDEGETHIIYQSVMNGATYRLEAEQVSNFPSLLGDPVASITVEGCAPNNNGPAPAGYVNMFSNGNSSPFIAVDCQVSIDSSEVVSFSQQGYPIGYGADAYIYPHTDLDYHVYFDIPVGVEQVVIRDTLSQYLDVMSIAPGASSHNYEWRLLGNGVVEFEFNNATELMDHGFIKYRINQKDNNQEGSQIKNKTAVYFDETSSATLNDVYHTVARNFLKVQQTTAVNTSKEEQIHVNVYPNPMKDQATIALEGLDLNGEEIQLEVLNAMGQRMLVQVGQNGLFQIQRNRLETGMYFYRITKDGELLSSGKLMVD